LLVGGHNPARGAGTQEAAEPLAPIFGALQFTAMTRPALFLAVVCLAFAATKAAPAVDTNPDWLQRPDDRALANAWPKQAPSNGAGGHVKLQCIVLTGGDLGDCKVLEEAPEGEGFGSAALNLASTFKMKPATHDGRPVESSIIIPVAFSPNQDSGPTSRDGGSPDWLGVLFAVVIVSVWVGWYLWVIRYSPTSDPPRLKRELEVDGAKVVSVERNGTRIGGRYSPSYRVYSVAVRERGGETTTRQICVQVTLFSDPTVVEAKTTDMIWFKSPKSKTPPSPFGKLDM